MHGRAAKRTVRHFGLDYDYQSRDTVPTDPFPAELEWLRERCAELAERRPDELVQVLVSRYPPGAGIGWHRDAPMFGRVIGASFGAPARMRFQRTTKEGERLVEELGLEPRSGYLLSGEARWTWQHSIPAAKELRYSITFRTLRDAR
jgi:alkylated DNA repair dioxygenase AlkB